MGIKMSPKHSPVVCHGYVSYVAAVHRLLAILKNK